MSEPVKLILSLSVSGGLFALVLFALKPFMRRRLSKSFQYYIWLVVLLRFIMPFSFGINLMDYITGEPSPSQETVGSDSTVNQPGETFISDNPVNPATEFQEHEYTIPYTPGDNVPKGSFMVIDPLKILTENLLWIWLAGAVISAAWNIIGYLRFVRYVRGVAYAVEMPDCGVKVYKSRFAPTPMLVGMIRPRIYLPDTPYTNEQIHNILLHELTHLRRRDVWLKWLAALVVSAHWFNPIAYLMRREFNRACELACDEAVIRKLDGAAKQSYGDTLISVVAESRYPVSVMSVTMCEEKKKLKERLAAIMEYKKKTKIAVLITAVLAVAITGSALAFGANFGLNSKTNPEILETPDSVIYTNNEYGFTLTLPESWNGYTLIFDEWEGYAISEEQYGEIIEKGPKLIIRHPLWTSENKRQDIPILIFTINQWELMYINGNFSIGAFPYPYELGRNSESVFALPPRYNVEFLTGWEEVQDIIYNALSPFEKSDDSFSISLDKLRQLASKGGELMIEDFEDYEYTVTDSEPYTMRFEVEYGYSVLVGADSPSAKGKPYFATLKFMEVDGIDIRYNDIEEYISIYPVPSELSYQIYGNLEIIMSSPAWSSVTGDYIREHQTEYDEIVNMGVTALPGLTAMLNNGEKGLRGNILWLIVQDIISAESSKPHSDWIETLLQSASRSLEKWSEIMGISLNDNSATRDGEANDLEIARAVISVTVDNLLNWNNMYPRIYTSGKKIKAVLDYIDDLTLKDEFPENPNEYYGSPSTITILFDDGTKSVYYHFGNMFFGKATEDGINWKRMEYEEAAKFDTIIESNLSD